MPKHVEGLGLTDNSTFWRKSWAPDGEKGKKHNSTMATGFRRINDQISFLMMGCGIEEQWEIKINR